MTTIWHNPACGTSRNVLTILRATGETPEVVDYLKTGWDEALLREIIAAAGLTLRMALREKGGLAAELGLTAPGISDAEILAAMILHPALVERPFVRTARGVKLCRPAALVGEILPRLPAAPVLATDGRVIFDPAPVRTAEIEPETTEPGVREERS